MTGLHGFELVEEREIAEIRTKAQYFRHVKSGARLLSLANDDENKAFGITFRTPPGDSTGVPHIMEHAVLCGSRKYPVKEPFVELMKGSLQTFLNAFTAPDRTSYPVASQNLQDFYNLVDVYLDAVFYPLLSEQALQQEGWHYELEDEGDPLAYKGVVFNEMKGAYSSPEARLGRHSFQSLFPDNTYGFDSAGNPRNIPDLTYADFKAFHKACYHPANAYIFFYGDDDPIERLRLLDGYLKDLPAQDVHTVVGWQSYFDQPRYFVFSFEPGAEEGDGEETDERKSMVTVNWLLPAANGAGGDQQSGEALASEADLETIMGLRILAYILIGTAASPLRKALIDSGLGEDLVGDGLESELRQLYFSTGLKGIELGAERRENGQVRYAGADRVEALILDTLQILARDGIDPETVAAAMNTVEFRLRENNTGSFPRGLLLMLRALTTWTYGGDPIQPLAYEEPLRAIRARLEMGEPYFERLIQRYWLDNPHRTQVVLCPEVGMQQRLEAEERERLEQRRAGMSQADLQAIIESTRQLKLRQETPDSPEALATIPSLGLEDLDKQNKLIPRQEIELAGATTLYHDLFTNGIVYLDLGFDMHRLPQEYLPYIPLFGRCLVEIGTESQDFVRLSQRIGRSTGGIYPTTLNAAVRDQAQAASWLFLRAKATVPQVDEMLGILRDILLTVRLDNRERFLQMALEDKAGMESSLQPSGHRLVGLRLRSLFSEADWAIEQMAGVSNLFFLRELVQAVEKDWPAVLEKLEAIRSLLLNRGGEGGAGMLVNVTLDAENWERIRPSLAGFIGSLPAHDAPRATWQRTAMPGYQGLSVPAQVNYVGKGANLFGLGYKLDGSLFVINKYLRSTWLWEKVRVQGGAYGGFCSFDHHSGMYTFLSYRDPNLLDTLDIYDQTGQFLRQLDSARLSQEELVKSIVGTIGEMDSYQLPDAKGYTSLVRYLAHDTDALRQGRREQVLSTTIEDFRRFGEVLDELREQGKVVVMGSQEALEAANQARPGLLDIQKVL